MKPPLLAALPGNEALAESLRLALGAERCALELRRFPDGETYLRYVTPVAGRDVVILAPLDRPDLKILPVIFAAATARELGADRVGLVAPYLPYMRQDRRFREGEAVTSTHFARMLSSQFDWLVTVDPHLHRRNSLSEIYNIPSNVVHAAPLISAWIAHHVENPLIIGPDSESEQWVAAVADRVGAPYLALEKRRHNDHEVDVTLPDITRWRGRTPVLIDDIASTAQTMLETLRQLKAKGFMGTACIAVHGIFAGDAYRNLIDAGAARIVTCNTIPHESNAIDVAPLLATGIVSLIDAKESHLAKPRGGI
jgi:ribose-phosphate pyrophosphokinase